MRIADGTLASKVPRVTPGCSQDQGDRPHDRNGGLVDNIRCSLDAASTAYLSAHGVFWVQDLASVDHGTLIEVQETPGTETPDSDPAGIERTLKLTTVLYLNSAAEMEAVDMGKLNRWGLKISR
jgi:hypothetical protein